MLITSSLLTTKTMPHSGKSTLANTGTREGVVSTKCDESLWEGSNPHTFGVAPAHLYLDPLLVSLPHVLFSPPILIPQNPRIHRCYPNGLEHEACSMKRTGVLAAASW